MFRSLGTRIQCSSHNSSQKKVRKVYSYNADKFFSDGYGNLLITGGYREKRCELLSRAILARKNLSLCPIFIFSEGYHLEDILVEAANAGQIGELFLISPNYKNYDFFSCLPQNQVVDFFTAFAGSKGYHDSRDLHDYTGSFLSVLSRYAPTKLAAISEFAKNTDLAIANAAGVNSVDYDIITGTPRGGLNFRRLLSSACGAFSCITTPRCNSGFSLPALCNRDCVVLINAPSPDFDAFAMYFIQEFKSMLHREFTLVFEDSLLLSSPALHDFLTLAKQRDNLDVYLSCENVLALPSNDAIGHFRKQITLLDGTIPPIDLQRIFSAYGQYSHFEATRTVSTPPRIFFSFKRSTSQGITPYSRERLMLEELRGYTAVLSGHRDAEIIATKRI